MASLLQGPLRWRVFPSAVRRGLTGEKSICRFPTSPCVSSSRPARISATSRIAGTRRWRPYIFGARNNIHIIDLAQTVPLLHQALKAVSDTVAKGGRVLFVGTKRQAADQIADAAQQSAQYYINSRWLGGMLTNWKTISGSIQRLRKVEEELAAGAVGLTKKERLMLSRERDKLEQRAGRHQGHGRHARPDLRDRHQQGTARDQGGQPPRHSGRRDPRHQLRSGRHRLPDPRQ